MPKRNKRKAVIAKKTMMNNMTLHQLHEELIKCGSAKKAEEKLGVSHSNFQEFFIRLAGESVNLTQLQSTSYEDARRRFGTRYDRKAQPHVDIDMYSLSFLQETAKRHTSVWKVELILNLTRSHFSDFLDELETTYDEFKSMSKQEIDKLAIKRSNLGNQEQTKRKREKDIAPPLPIKKRRFVEVVEDGEISEASQISPTLIKESQQKTPVINNDFFSFKKDPENTVNFEPPKPYDIDIQFADKLTELSLEGLSSQNNTSIAPQNTIEKAMREKPIDNNNDINVLYREHHVYGIHNNSFFAAKPSRSPAQFETKLEDFFCRNCCK